MITTHILTPPVPPLPTPPASSLKNFCNSSFFNFVFQKSTVVLLSLLRRPTRTTTTAQSHLPLALACSAHHTPIHPLHACKIINNPWPLLMPYNCALFLGLLRMFFWYYVGRSIDVRSNHIRSGRLWLVSDFGSIRYHWIDYSESRLELDIWQSFPIFKARLNLTLNPSDSPLLELCHTGHFEAL